MKKIIACTALLISMSVCMFAKPYNEGLNIICINFTHDTLYVGLDVAQLALGFDPMHGLDFGKNCRLDGKQVQSIYSSNNSFTNVVSRSQLGTQSWLTTLSIRGRKESLTFDGNTVTPESFIMTIKGKEGADNFVTGYERTVHMFVGQEYHFLFYAGNGNNGNWIDYKNANSALNNHQDSKFPQTNAGESVIVIGIVKGEEQSVWEKEVGDMSGAKLIDFLKNCNLIK